MQLTTDLKDLATVPAFRTLLAVRLVSQTGDGMFQAGLATLFFFQPQNMTTAGGVAAALVVMLLPFSVVGPFTGPFIDRWRRRQTLLYANLARAVLVMATTVVLRAVGVGPVLYVLVLVALGVGRFLLSVLSAGLPQVIARERLLVANSIVPTLGGAATALGAVIGLALRLLLPEGASRDVGSLVVAALLYSAAAAVVARLSPDQLGPQHRDEETGLGSALAAAATDLVDAVAYLARRATPGLALSTMALHRFVYGMEVVTIILASRNLLAAPEDADRGLALFGALMGAMLAGQGAAVVLTPLAHERISPAAWVVTCLVGGSIGQIVLVASHDQRWMMAGLLVFGTGVQGAKIAVDTIVQADTADAYRGRAFSIYDVLFNTAECVAAGAAVLVLPDVGWSPVVQAVLVVFVWGVAAAYWRAVRALGGVPRAVTGETVAGGETGEGGEAGADGSGEAGADGSGEEAGKKASGSSEAVAGGAARGEGVQG